MLKFLRSKRSQSLLEFMLLIIFIIGAMLVFQKYIARGISGRWKTAADTLGQGKIYDPDKTKECVYHQEFKVWYDQDCYEENNCNCQWETMSTPATCYYCVLECSILDPLSDSASELCEDFLCTCENVCFLLSEDCDNPTQHCLNLINGCQGQCPFALELYGHCKQ